MSEIPIRPLLKQGHDRLLVLFFLRTYFEKRRKTKLLSSVAQKIFYFIASSIDHLKERDYLFKIKFFEMNKGAGLASLLIRYKKNVFEEDAFVRTSTVSGIF